MCKQELFNILIARIRSKNLTITEKLFAFQTKVLKYKKKINAIRACELGVDLYFCWMGKIMHNFENKVFDAEKIHTSFKGKYRRLQYVES